MKQRTITSDITLSGQGLHSGEQVTVQLCPAPARTGIVFVRTDLPERPEVRVDVQSLSPEGITRCSMIQHGKAKIFTLEHLMAALAGLSIDNVVINIDGEEVPGLDGSARPFVDAILDGGIQEYEQDQEYISVKEPITVESNGARISIEPSDQLSIEYQLEYPHPLLNQRVRFDINQDTFVQDIAPARTFCLKEEADYLKAQGLGKGANPQNTLIVGDQGPEDNTFRFPDECGRHKLLDCVGDFYLLGKPLKGKVTAYKSGHSLNNKLVRKIAEQVGSALPC